MIKEEATRRAELVEAAGQVLVVVLRVTPVAQAVQTAGVAPAQEAQLLATVHWIQERASAERP